MEGRLIISKVVLENFKSYAGVRTIGPFHNSLSAVVGPNGSGKSNLLECLLFTFGKRAKKMRLNKISELIHKSKLHPSLTYAKVTVHFENISETFPHSSVPGSDFTVSRTVFKNNTSNYKVNEEDSSFDAVSTLLKEKSIDLEHNRFLILQGEVEQIALMKPKASDEAKSGLLEYLEEIIGSDKYIQDIVKTENELERISEELTVVKIQADQAGMAVNVLNEDLTQLTEFIFSQKQLSELNNLKFHIQLVKNSQDINSREAEYKNLKNELKQLESEYSESKSKDLQIVKEIEQKNLEIKIIQKQSKILIGQIQDIINEDRKKIALCEKLLAQQKSLSTDLEEENKKSDQATHSISELSLKLLNSEERFHQIKDQLSSSTLEYDTLHTKVILNTKDLQNKKEQLTEVINRYKQQYNSIKSEIDNHHKIKLSRNQQIEAQSSEILSLREQLQVSSNSLNKLKLDEDSDLETLNTKKKSLQELNAAQKEIRQKIDECDKQIAVNKSVLYDIENDEKLLESSGKIYMEIINAKKNGKLNGFVGRLGDLGSIDQKYDIAISSASSMFDSFVTKNVSCAQELIEFVRIRGLGKVNILILEKIAEVPEKVFRSPDPKAQRLFDLVNILHPEVKKCFYLALKDTLVSETLEDCRRIAFGLEKRWRVVCVTGEVVNPTGEMVGFSKVVSGKVKNTSNEAKKIDGLTKSSVLSEMRNLAETKERLENELKSAEGKIIMMNDSVKTLENKLNISKIEKNNISEKIKSLEIRLEILNKRKNDEVDSENEKTPEHIANQENSVIKLENLLKLKTNELKNIETSIDEIGGEEFKELKNKCAHLKNLENELLTEISKSEQKRIQLQKDLKKSKEIIESIQTSIKSNEESIEQIKSSKLSLETEVIEKANTNQKLQETLDSKNAELQKLLSEKQNFELIFTEYQNKHHALSQQIQDLRKDLNILKNRLNIFSQQIQNNRDKYIQDLLPIISDTSLNLTNPNILSKDIENLLFDPLKDFSEEEVRSLTNKLGLLEDQEKILSKKLENVSVDFTLLEKYKKRQKDFQVKTKNLNELKTKEQQKKDEYQSLRALRLSVFYKGFLEISACLKDIYRLITNGGDADLELADTTDPFSEGIVFTVRPPAKAWKKMTNLSGGEKTLSSLALVFALHTYKPNALYVMDEVDAALDFMNVGIVANYIKQKTKNAQFIVVSLRYQMFELADQLIGVYKIKGASDTLCISPYIFITEKSKNKIIEQTVKNIQLCS